MSVDSDGRAYILARTTDQMASMFRTLANHCAVDAVRERDPDRVFLGIVALVIKNLSFDSGDTRVALAVLYNSARKLGLNPDELLERATTICSPEMGNFLIDFSRRPESQKSLKSFLLEEIEGKWGFDYREIPWTPTIPDSRANDSLVSFSLSRPQNPAAYGLVGAFLRMVRRFWSRLFP